MAVTSASNTLTAAEQMQSNYEKFKDKFKDANEDLINSDTFLNLLVAEMTNQDPMEPTSNTEFVTQMAQFSSLTYSKQSAEYSKSNYASSLVGKTVTASKMDGSSQVTKTGVVESVMKNGDDYTIKVDGVSFDISNVTAISDTRTDDSDSQLSGNTLGEYIAKASSMIGMAATVQAKADKGTVLDSGVVTSIQVKDGKVNLIINDKAYALENVVEVAYPTLEPDDSTNGATDSGKTDGADKNTGAYDSTGASGSTENTETHVIENSEEKAAYVSADFATSADDVEEVTEKAKADAYLEDDVPDLEDFT